MAMVLRASGWLWYRVSGLRASGCLRYWVLAVSQCVAVVLSISPWASAWLWYGVSASEPVHGYDTEC